MSIEFLELPYPKDALEPFMSARTLEFHHGKHYKKYVDTTNKLIAGTRFEDLSLKDIVTQSFKEEVEIFHNAAQAWNHAFFFSCLKQNTTPSLSLKTLIASSFGSVEEFKKEFSQQAVNLFGSGWTWLVKTRGGDLKIRALPDAQTPLIYGELALLTCDVWEHAYYLDYQNERDRFVQNFWSIVDWDYVEACSERELPKVVQPLLSPDYLVTPKQFEDARGRHH